MFRVVSTQGCPGNVTSRNIAGMEAVTKDINRGVTTPARGKLMAVNGLVIRHVETLQPEIDCGLILHSWKEREPPGNTSCLFVCRPERGKAATFS